MNSRPKHTSRISTVAARANRAITPRAKSPAALIESLENRTFLSASVHFALPTPVASAFAANQPTLLGIFGIVNGKQTKLKVSLDQTHTATFSLAGGSATALQDGGAFDLEIASGTNLTVNVSRQGSIVFNDINIATALNRFVAPAAQISGTLTASGSVGTMIIGALSGNANFTAGVTKYTGTDLTGTLSSGGNVTTLKLGAVSGNINVAGNITRLTTKAVSGAIYAAGQLGTANVVGALTGQIVAGSLITNLSATSMSGATVLAGANLGSDGLLGGTGAAADTFAAGTIGKLHVAGAIFSSFIGAGADPSDGIFGNGNDTSAGLGLIKSIAAASADDTTRFETAAFGIAKLPRKVVLSIDPRFIIL